MVDTALLTQTVQQITVGGKGILAADESNSTAGKRLAVIGCDNTAANRQAMRALFFETPGAAAHIGGVILYDETFYQQGSNGTFVADMQTHGVVPGIKVDLGLEPFGDDGEQVTKGLETLDTRLPQYFKDGARFAKWRAVFTVSEVLPSDGCIAENARRLAAYAQKCQQHGIVPIVEPEVLMDDPIRNTHTIDQAFAVTSRVHQALFAALDAADVYLPGVLLKPSMVVAGKSCLVQPSVQQVAELTVKCLQETVPAAVGGVVFLSGGQTDAQATEHLRAINQLVNANDQNAPARCWWPITFSYGRALQGAALAVWQGKPENMAAARKVFLTRCQENHAAALGK